MATTNFNIFAVEVLGRTLAIQFVLDLKSQYFIRFISPAVIFLVNLKFSLEFLIVSKQATGRLTYSVLNKAIQVFFLLSLAFEYDLLWLFEVRARLFRKSHSDCAHVASLRKQTKVYTLRKHLFRVEGVRQGDDLA